MEANWPRLAPSPSDRSMQLVTAPDSEKNMPSAIRGYGRRSWLSASVRSPDDCSSIFAACPARPRSPVTTIASPGLAPVRSRIRSLRTRPKAVRSEEHTSELQSRLHLVCRLLLEKKKNKRKCPEHHSTTP